MSAPIANSLSARLLMLTMFFIMVVELLVFPTSIAKFKVADMHNRIDQAYLSYLAINAAFDESRQMVAAENLLNQFDLYQIQVYEDNKLINKIRRFDAPLPQATYDIRSDSFIQNVSSAISTLFSKDNRILRVVGAPSRDKDLTFTVDFEEAPLRTALMLHLQDVLAVSILISVITAMLIFISIQVLMVNPVRVLTQGMTTFRKDPEKAENIIVPSGRHDEIGTAEFELYQMQEQIRAALRQKDRLAAIGTAVTKINHDLRGILSTAQLVSDRLSQVNDPQVQQAAQTILVSVNKAVELCSQTLKYAREGVPTLNKEQFWFVEFLQQLGEQVNTLSQGQLKLQARVPQDLSMLADKKQLFRVFLNLCKNAYEAGATRMMITVTRQGQVVSMWLNDNGPGLPGHMLEKLFQPFAGSTRKGGSGLGLAIAKEILQAHGGDMTLAENSAEGATFKLDLPTPATTAQLPEPQQHPTPKVAA